MLLAVLLCWSCSLTNVAAVQAFIGLQEASAQGDPKEGCVQGNRPEELPEVVMACARVSRIDLYKVEPFPGRLRKTESHRTTVEMDPNSPPLTAHTFPDDTVEASPRK